MKLLQFALTRPVIINALKLALVVGMPRSTSRSSTFRNDSGKRTYIITTSRMISGEAL